MAKVKLEQQLRNMKLHKTMQAGNIVILKVPGGWIYWNQCPAEKGAMVGVFVPNSEESFSMFRKMRKELKQPQKQQR